MTRLWSLPLLATWWITTCVGTPASATIASWRRLQPRTDSNWTPDPREYIKLGDPQRQKWADQLYFDELEKWFQKRQGPLTWEGQEGSARVFGSLVNNLRPPNGPWVEEPASLEELRRIRDERGIERRSGPEQPAALPHGRLHEWQMLANEEYFNALELWFIGQNGGGSRPFGPSWKEHEAGSRSFGAAMANQAKPRTPPIEKEPASLEELRRIRRARGIPPSPFEPPTQPASSTDGRRTPDDQDETTSWSSFKQVDLGRLGHQLRGVRPSWDGLRKTAWAGLASAARSRVYMKTPAFRPIPV